MSEATHLEEDLEAVKARIRREAAAMRARAAAAVPLGVCVPGVWAFNWLEFKSRLKAAADLAPLGGMPLMHRFQGVKRRLALAAARVVLYLARFLTTRQTDFNLSLLEVLRETGEAMHDVETRVVRQAEQIRLLEAYLNRLSPPTTAADLPEPRRKAS
jgi:hypothetical protein